MTGYGFGSTGLGRGILSVEVRSLNHRFLDIRVRLPPDLSEHGFYLEQALRGRLERGRFDVTVRSEGCTAMAPRLDVERARGVYAALCGLRDELAPGTEVPVTVLASLPELMAGLGSTDSEQVRQALDTAIDTALKHMHAMRIREGEALTRDLEALLSEAGALHARIAARSAGAVEQHRIRLRERLQRLLAETSLCLDSGRLETEVAVLADRSDVAEELTRLRCHFDEFARLLQGGSPVGRRLDFLLQEIAREANTIGAKSADADLSHLIVDLRSVVERMREQVQNVE